MTLTPKEILNEYISGDPSAHKISAEDSAHLKRVLLEIALDVQEVCEKHHLHLMLAGGTLLGTIRHHGFIPWDDDLDFCMLRKDYEKLASVFDAELSDKYELRCPNTDHPNNNRFMQILKKGTSYTTVLGDSPVRPNKIYIDIFPMDVAPDSVFFQYLKGYCCNALMTIASAVGATYYPDQIEAFYRKSVKGRFLLAGRDMIGKLFSFRDPVWWFNHVDMAIRAPQDRYLGEVKYRKHKRTSDSLIIKKIKGRKKNVRMPKYITSATGRKHYIEEIMPVSEFLPVKKLSFEGHLFDAPRNPDYYLRRMYGDDYMKLPPVEKRESHFIKHIDFGDDAEDY